MLRVQSNRKVFWPCFVDLSEDGGPKEYEFSVQFELLTKDQMADLNKMISDAVAVLPDGATDVQRAEATKAAKVAQGERIKQQVKDWRDIADDKSQPIPFSQKNMQRVINSEPRIETAIAKGFGQAQLGAKPKNS